MKALFYFLLWIWQFPQNIVGGIKLYCTKIQHVIRCDYDVKVVYSNEQKGMHTFGSYIYVNSCIWRKDMDQALTRASVIQGLKLSRISRISGPFYFLVVAVLKVRDILCGRG